MLHRRERRPHSVEPPRDVRHRINDPGRSGSSGRGHEYRAATLALIDVEKLSKRGHAHLEVFIDWNETNSIAADSANVCDLQPSVMTLRGYVEHGIGVDTSQSALTERRKRPGESEVNGGRVGFGPTARERADWIVESDAPAEVSDEPRLDLGCRRGVAPRRQLGVERSPQHVTDDPHERGCRLEETEVHRAGRMNCGLGQQAGAPLHRLSRRLRLIRIDLLQPQAKILRRNRWRDRNAPHRRGVGHDHLRSPIEDQPLLVDRRLQPGHGPASVSRYRARAYGVRNAAQICRSGVMALRTNPSRQHHRCVGRLKSQARVTMAP